MTAEQLAETINPRVEASLPFVEALARRVAATMPHSIDLGDLVQDGVIGLIDAAGASRNRAASSSRPSPSAGSAAR